MNTIKIYLAESGRIVDVKKDFPLYQGQYQSKLLNVYVPTSIIVPQILQATSTSVQIGMTYTTRSGAVQKSPNYYMRYLKTLVYQGIEYALYERKLPQAFTLYAGKGENAPVLVMNVVNIQAATATEAEKIIDVTTSQTCPLDVEESTFLDQDEPIDPTELEIINSEINAIISVTNDKQDKVDTSIALTDFPTQKSVVGAINDIGGQVALNTNDISDNMGDIAALQADVIKIENSIGSSETPVGQMTGNSLPTQQALTDFTVEKMGRQPKANDSIIFILETPNEANKNYKYIYSVQDVWSGYEIPSHSQAENGQLGVIKGTYSIGSQNDILVNILGGEIVAIFYKDANGAYQNIRTKINLMDVTQTSIINGTQVVGISTKALQDQLGNVINLTYAKQSDVYTKTESDEKYLPSTYTNIYYYSADGLVEDIPTTPATGIQFTKSVSQVGAVNIFSVSRELEGNYNFTKNTADVSEIWVATSRDCTVEFRLTTKVQKAGSAETLLGADLTGEIPFIANSPTVIRIPSIYSALGSNSFKANAGDTFSKTFDIISTETTPTIINVFSNAIYPSTFNLSAQSIVFDVNKINGFKTIHIKRTEWVSTSGYYTITIPQTRHQQPPSTNYILELQSQSGPTTYQRIGFTPTINTNGDIAIQAYTAYECDLLIGCVLEPDQRAVLTLTNPTTLPAIDYSQYGALRIIQNVAATSLTLQSPTDQNKFYTFFVSNDATSTSDILVNSHSIIPNSGVQFKWNGQSWQVGEQATNTDEIYDKDKSQLLSTTLSQIATSVSGNTTEINELQTSKLGTDLSNVDMEDLKAKVFACNFNIAKYVETSAPIDLLSSEYSGFNKLQLVFSFTENNQTIIQEIPAPINSVIDVYLENGSYSAIMLVINPATGVEINKQTFPISLTSQGFAGTLEPTTAGWTWKEKQI